MSEKPETTAPATEPQGAVKQQPQPQQSQGKPQVQQQQQQQQAPGQTGGHRQNYAGGANNKNYYNKRNNGNYAGKGNNAGGNAANKQYAAGGYNAYQQPMYAGNYYYAYSYPQGIIPGMNGVPASYPPTSAPAAQQYPTSPSIAKVKITDKDGKQVSLEEKTKSSNTTPKPAAAQLVSPATPETSSSPAPAAASNTSSPAPAAASAASTAASASAASTAAEEFRKKILERAQLAKKKKEEEKAKLDAEAKAKEAKANPEPVKPVEKVAETPAAPVEPVAEKPVEDAAEKPAEKPVEAPTPAPVEASTPAPVEASTPAPVEASTPAPVEASTPAPVETPVETPAPASAEVSAEKSEPVAETVKEPVSEPVSAETAVETFEPESKKEVAEESAPVETKSEEQSEKTEAASQEEDSTEKDAVNDEADDNEDEQEHADEGPVFDLSSYFERLKTAEPIDDPFSFSYPYPLTGVDARWKAGAKKYRYDPQFLLQFGDYVQYPIDDAWKEKLEGLGIVPAKKSSGGPQRMNSNRPGQSQGGRFNGSLPNRLGQFNDRQNSRNSSRRRGGGSNTGGPRDRSLRNRNQSKKKESEEPPKPAEEVKPLVPSANRWVPRSRVKKEEVKLAPDGSVMLESDEIERKVNSALNKLTLEMFEPITEDLLKIARQSIWEEDAKTVKQVISLTFAKACDEPYWSSVYAQFFAKMLKEVPDDLKDVNTLTKNGEPATGGDLARRILLATCQVEYEKGWVDKLPTNEDGSPLEPEMMSDEYYIMAAAKRRGLGLVKFIGNLYILNMLNDQVILHCLRDQSKNVVDPSEDSLENLAQLIKTVGPRFEATERNRAALNLVYDNIQQVLDNCKLPSRIRFMLMDLQDLRRSNWKSQKQDAGPKTIKEIHNEAELKKIEEGRASAEKRRQNKGGFNNSGFGGNDSRSNSTRSGSSWGNKKDSRAPTKDSRGFTSVSRTQSNRPVQEPSAPAPTNLPPRETSKRTDSMASNMFAALGDEEEVDAHAN